MSDTTELQIKARAPLKGGGGVLAIIPQDLDAVWRMARMAVLGEMAPKSLVDKKDVESATAACAIAIMAGAELGLTPLMALRSYAVVNGRPSLWGDGLKAVVRQSGRCEYIRTGSDQTMGWCEAKRSDTGEEKRVEFTFEQAKLAQLDKKTGPWTAGYRDVMMERRATNRCLNDLFADVLGGIVDAQEAMDDGPIFDEPRDVTPTRSSPPTPPPAPEQPEALDVEAFMAKIISAIALAEDEDSLIAAWDELDIEATLSTDHEDVLAEAFEIRQKRIAAFNEPADGDDDTQDDMFPGDAK